MSQSAADILKTWFPDRNDLLAHAMWQCIGFNMLLVADGIDPKIAGAITMVLMHSKQNEVARVSRGLLGGLGL